MTITHLCALVWGRHLAIPAFDHGQYAAGVLLQQRRLP